mmetsp:Transcript_41129/g.57858  ORF Transcript_41129/g.57858 Transcript_41129/m.57858 type:complete len:212 (+) Transcript_41129:63-698(+)
MTATEEAKIAALEAEIKALKRHAELQMPSEEYVMADEGSNTNPLQNNPNPKLEALRNIPIVQLLDRNNRSGREDGAVSYSKSNSSKGGKFPFPRGRRTKQELELLNALDTLETDKVLCEEEMRQKIQQSEKAIETLEKALIDADLTARHLQKEIESIRSSSLEEVLATTPGTNKREKSPPRKESFLRSRSPEKSSCSTSWRRNKSMSPGRA